MPYLMGIDLGTTSVRAIIINEKGNVKGEGAAEYPIYHPRPMWAEQDPVEWWNGTKIAIAVALKKSGIDHGEIKSIGLSGQMHGLVLLGSDCEPVGNCILWCDQRTGAQCDYIMQKKGKDIVRITCNPALTGFTLPKIIWVMKNDPDVYAKVKKILLPKDYIRFKLTGEFATDVSDASGTLMLDVKKRQWSEEILSAFKVNSNFLPRVLESPEVSAEINKSASGETGLREGTPVVAGAGDQAAAGVGNGIVEKGLFSSTIGTSGVIFACLEKVKTDSKMRTHTFCHALPGKWHIMGVVLSAGASLRWFRDNFCTEEVNYAKSAKLDAYEILSKRAKGIKPGCEGLIFLPYIMGERTPYPDPYARGVFFGLTPRHTKSHLIRAVMEGVAFGLRDSLEIIKKLDIGVGEVRASGGGSRSALWRQIQADVNNTEMVTINASEGSAFGAALLAGVGAGIYGNVEEACRTTIHVVSHTEPIKENVKRYDEYYRIYHSLYPKLKDGFESISRISEVA